MTVVLVQLLLAPSYSNMAASPVEIGAVGKVVEVGCGRPAGEPPRALSRRRARCVVELSKSLCAPVQSSHSKQRRREVVLPQQVALAESQSRSPLPQDPARAIARRGAGAS